MTVVVGIHNGHHASCAVVRDGVLVAALAQERLTRIKHDGQEYLSNRLPLTACLSAAGLTINDVDLFVSSFQAASPGGVGLQRPLIEPSFSLFDPRVPNHIVISHHYAHAAAALASSGFEEATILVCDLGGSTTYDGSDYLMPFVDFERYVSSASTHLLGVRTECLSIYKHFRTQMQLVHREFFVPHNAADVFVNSAASLYDNVARFVFKRENAHGELMALASMYREEGLTSTVRPGDMFSAEGNSTIIFCNDWQTRVQRYEDELLYAPLAYATQRAFESILIEHAKLARKLTGCSALAVSGGAFLNITVNSAIAQGGLFSAYHVPSAPHDSGVSVGCANVGWTLSKPDCAGLISVNVSDRLGPSYGSARIEAALRSVARNRTNSTVRASSMEVARLLATGGIVARFQGRSEFGPRALGSRSLLASPLLVSSKRRLNLIKGRQPWRPVAPIVTAEAIKKYFHGPELSPHMNFLHFVRAEHRQALAALEHPDGSTRAQSLDRRDDASLHELLSNFGEMVGYPILINTSLNGPGEPIIETPEDALTFFETHPDVDALLIDGQLLKRDINGPSGRFLLAPDTIISIISPAGKKRIFLSRRDASMEISSQVFEILYLHGAAVAGRRRDDTHFSNLNEQISREVSEASRLGLLVYSDDESPNDQ